MDWQPHPLPTRLPIFPLTGVLLLPRARLPLNIFEPRYLAMVEDALGTPDRLIGMVQPMTPHDSTALPTVYRVGCAGRITSFTDSGATYQITLTGIIRFAQTAEEPLHRGYRRITPDFTPYGADRGDPGEAGLDRARLGGLLRTYFARNELQADWASVEKATDELLINTLAMVCPFRPAEKQALLEAPDLAARARLLAGLVEAALHEPAGGGMHH